LKIWVAGVINAIEIHSGVEQNQKNLQHGNLIEEAKIVRAALICIN